MIDENPVKIKPNYYTGINDLPMYNFDMLCKTKDFQYLLHDLYDDFQDGFDEDLHWEKIYDEFLSIYGVGDKYKEYCKLIKKASIALNNVYNKNQPAQRTFYNIYTKMANALIIELETGDSEGLEISCAKLSKYMGYRVLSTEISVREFHSYIEMAKKESQYNG